MLTTVDQLQAGESYLLPDDLARVLIARGKAYDRAKRTFEAPVAGPSEIKIVEPVAKTRKAKRSA